MANVSFRKLLSHIRIADIKHVRDVFLSDPKELINKKSIHAIFEAAALADSPDCVKIAFEYFLKAGFSEVLLFSALDKAFIRSLTNGYEQASSEILDCMKEIKTESEYQEYVDLMFYRAIEQTYPVMLKETSFRITALNILADKGADINSGIKTYRGFETTLLKALRNCDIETAIAIINHKNFDITRHQGKNAVSPLIHEILHANKKEIDRSGQIFCMLRPYLTADKVRLLHLFLKKGGDLNDISTGMSPLSVAAINNDYESMVIMLNAGANPYIQNDCGKQLKDLACETGNPDIAKLIEEHMKQQILKRGIGQKEKFLIEAICSNNDNAVREAIKTGADVNFLDKPNKNRLSAFMYAINSGADTKIFETLLENGFDPNMPDKYGNTAVNLLVLELYPLKDIIAEDRNQHSFIYNGTKREKEEHNNGNVGDNSIKPNLETYKYKLTKVGAITEMLIAACADMNAGNKYGLMMEKIEISGRNLHDDYIQAALVSSGLAFMLIDAYNYVSNNTLSTSYTSSNIPYKNLGIVGEERKKAEKITAGIISKMLCAGLDPNSCRVTEPVNKYGWQHHNDDATLLHAAAAAGMPEVVSCLLEAGADPNSENEQGGTPLYLSLPCRYINSKFNVINAYADALTAEKDLSITENTFRIIDMIVDAGGILKIGDGKYNTPQSLTEIINRNNKYQMFPALKARVTNLQDYILKKKNLAKEDSMETEEGHSAFDMFDII